MRFSPDAGPLESELEELAGFSETVSPAITRVVFSEVDLAARDWLKAKCLAAGLTLRQDAVGNLFARWAGSEPDLSAVGTGSHIDAIPNSGRYDGTVGVLGGLEAIRALQRAAFKPRRSIELLLFTSEEPTRFGLGCLGSRLLSGTLPAGRADGLRDAGGVTLEEIRQRAGFVGDLQQVQLPASYYSAFIELHIEQGPLLEAKGISIGAVTSIAAPAALRLHVQGSGGHAGTVLMRDRRDALLGAAEMAIAVEATALTTGSNDSVATTGLCQVYPGAVNSVPSRVTLEIDVRDVDSVRRDGMVTDIQDACRSIGQRRNLEVEIEIINSDAPATCSELVIENILQSAAELNLPSMRMVSRAYHDSLFMSRIAPVSMIFVPCRLGMSHRPEEFSATSDIANGVAVLAGAVARLSS